MLDSASPVHHSQKGIANQYSGLAKRWKVVSRPMFTFAASFLARRAWPNSVQYLIYVHREQL